MNNNNFSWKYLCSDANKILKEVDILIARSTLARNTILKLSTDNKGNCIKIIGILADDTFEFNSFHSLSKLLKLVAPTKKIRDVWSDVDKALVMQSEKFNNDQELYKHLTGIISDKNLDESVDKLFFNKIMKCFSKYDLAKGTSNIRNDISTLENKIIKNIHNGEFQQNDLCNLVKMRNKYSKSLKFDSYTSLKSNINSADLQAYSANLQNTLKSLTSNAHQTCVDELKMICTNLKQDKVSINDIVRYKNNLINNYKIPLRVAMTFVFNIISEKFGLEFTKLDNISTWSDDVPVYVAKYSGQVFGYIYVDLLTRQGKLSSVLSIVLNDAVIYPYNSGSLRIPVSALVGNLQDKVTYFDIINIFREMGPLVHTLYHRSKYEIIIEPDMKLLMSCLFEHIAEDIDTIKKLALLTKVSPEDVHNIIILDRAFRLKHKCINTLFDYYLHGRQFEGRQFEGRQLEGRQFEGRQLEGRQFEGRQLEGRQLEGRQLEGRQFEGTNINSLHELDLTNRYNTITKSILNKSADQYNFPTQLPYDIVIQLIYNGGLMYTDITNSIVSFNLYTLLKEKNLFPDFVNEVLREPDLSFNTAITSFINSKSNKSICSDKDKIQLNEEKHRMAQLDSRGKQISHSVQSNGSKTSVVQDAGNKSNKIKIKKKNKNNELSYNDDNLSLTDKKKSKHMSENTNYFTESQ